MEGQQAKRTSNRDDLKASSETLQDFDKREVERVLAEKSYATMT